jgi:hypothetical protein
VCSHLTTISLKPASGPLHHLSDVHLDVSHDHRCKWQQPYQGRHRR